MSEARILRCDHCGGAVPLKVLAATAICPFCGQEVGVPDRIRSRLAGYAMTLFSAFQTAQTERRAAAAPHMNPAFLANLSRLALAMSALPLIVALLAAGLGGGPVVVGIVVVGALVFSFVAFGYLQRPGSHPVRPLVAPDVAAVVCSSCGATQVFVAGGVTSACRSCRAALLPTPAVMAKVQGAVAGMVFRERMERWRTERAGWASLLHNSRVFTSTHVLVVGALLSALFLLLPGFALVRLGKKEIWSTLGLLLIGVLAALATAYGFTRRQRLSRAWSGAIRALVTDHRGAPVVASTWLDARWAGPVTDEILYGDWAYYALEFHVGGYEALLVTNTETVKGQQPRIMVLLAAWIPGVSDEADALPSSSRLQAPSVDVLRAKIASYGFDVDLEAAGIVASARPDRVDLLGAHPERAVELAQVVRSVAQLALALRAQPITEVLLGNVAPSTPDRPVSEGLPADGGPPISDERRQEIEAERQQRPLFRAADRPASRSSTYKQAGILGASGVLLFIFKAMLGLGGRVISKTDWSILWLLLLTGVVVVGLGVLGRTSSYASKVASTLGKFPTLDDGRLVALALTEVEPGDWFVAHWQGSAPDTIPGAVPSGAVRWVLTGNVDELPVMLVCILHEPMLSVGGAKLHLFVACPQPDRRNRETKAYERIVALGCEVQTSWSGVYVSRDKLGSVLSVEKLSSICRSAVELARE